jgi:lipoprotein-anchoring transpeptidase ErfK/SrfK
MRVLGVRVLVIAPLVILVIAVGMLGSATGQATTTAGSPPPGAPLPTPTTPTGPAPAPAGQPPTPAKPTVHTKLTALPPSTVTDGTARLRVRLSADVDPKSPPPMLAPHVAGSWSIIGNAYYFTPTSTLLPCASYTLTVWAATTASGRLPLGSRHTSSFNVACPTIHGLQQTLTRLGYLPYTLHTRYHLSTPSGPRSRALAARAAYDPPIGRLVANVPAAPKLSYGTLDTATRGALMVFQGVHHMTPTGTPDRASWISLLAADTLDRRNPSPYTFVTVSESIPQTLEVHRGHHVALSTPANTGVAGAATEQGTFPIYARYSATTMTGTNPDGTHYSDPGVPWVNYFNGGDAVHGFPRPSYGSPQSNGCVELPIGTAANVYRMLAIGDLVIVS